MKVELRITAVIILGDGDLKEMGIDTSIIGDDTIVDMCIASISNDDEFFGILSGCNHWEYDGKILEEE